MILPHSNDFKALKETFATKSIHEWTKWQSAIAWLAHAIGWRALAFINIHDIHDARLR